MKKGCMATRNQADLILLHFQCLILLEKYFPCSAASFLLFLLFSGTVVHLSISSVALLLLFVCAHWCVYLFLWAMAGMWFSSMGFMLLGDN